MKDCYKFQTSVGPSLIAKFPTDYQAIFDNRKIASFASASQAAEALGNGHKLNLFEGAFRNSYTLELMIPADLSEWECFKYD